MRQCNVDVAVAQKQKHLHMRKEWWKKLFVAGWGLLIGGDVFLFVGGTALKGGSLSELPKTAFLIRFQLEIDRLGNDCFSSFGLFKLNIIMDQKHPWEVFIL